MTDYRMKIEPASLGIKLNTDEPKKEAPILCQHKSISFLRFPYFYCKECHKTLRFLLIGGRPIMGKAGPSLWDAVYTSENEMEDQNE